MICSVNWDIQGPSVFCSFVSFSLVSLGFFQLVVFVFFIGSFYCGYCPGTLAVFALQSPEPHLFVLYQFCVLSLANLTLHKLYNVLSEQVLNLLWLEDVLNCWNKRKSYWILNYPKSLRHPNLPRRSSWRVQGVGQVACTKKWSWWWLFSSYQYGWLLEVSKWSWFFMLKLFKSLPKSGLFLLRVSQTLLRRSKYLFSLNFLTSYWFYFSLASSKG